MCTNVIVLHIFIDFSHDAPAQILRATTTPDFWARLVIGLRTVWVAGCSMARKRSARWTLWPCTRTMVSRGFTRSTCLLNCLMPELTKVQKFIKFQLYLITSYFQFWNFDSPIYLPTYQSASCIICTGCLTSENPPSSRVHWGKLGHEVKWDIELWAPMIFLNTNSAMEFYYYRSFQYVSYNLVYIAAYQPFLYRYNSLYKIKHHTNIRSLRKRTKLFPIESPC